jgi:hypothetical protein
MPQTTPSALGRARVGNRDARCRLQQGNDAVAPTTLSPNRVRRKGFSPASLPPSSANGQLHQTTPLRRCRGATARPPPRAPPRCKDQGRPCHQGTVDSPLLNTRANHRWRSNRQRTRTPRPQGAGPATKAQTRPPHGRERAQPAGPTAHPVALRPRGE